ncbi:MAG: hypothetical protein HOV80_30285 [Polyangiaceae bacterium]|nr:hypothetical protein [Polyangiaceae bacterium]
MLAYLRRMVRSASWAVACVMVLAPLVTGAGIRADDLACEHAAIVLDECCPLLTTSQLDCDYDSGGCGGEPEPALLTERESNCIRQTSCEELVDDGVCERVLARADARADAKAAGEAFDVSEEEESVCP